MIRCNVCGHEFQPVIKNHYVSRDCDESGVVTVIKSNEVKIYDSFDCPACGCQSIPQERKRRVPAIKAFLGAEEEGENETNSEAETN